MSSKKQTQDFQAIYNQALAAGQQAEAEYHESGAAVKTRHRIGRAFGPS
jgi:hypothetical protein